MVDLRLWVLLFWLFQFDAAQSASTNVALGKPATQTKDENYAGWTWSADYAVDGCKDRDSPDSQQCCSTSIPNYPKTENKWSVDLLGPYVIDRIIIFGRSDTSSQLEGFQLYYLDTDGVTEVPLYTDPGFSYGDTGDGLYTIPVDPVITTSSLIIRRPVYITLCEVEVYGACMDGFYGPECSMPCGNCAGGEACNHVDGMCPSGCEPGWVEGLCSEAVASPTGGPIRTNVAYLKPATQSNDETYGGFNWTAAYAVEGCTDRDNLVGQTCCSTAIPIEGQEPATYWSVDLLGLYSIDLIKIFGRSDMTTQLDFFQLNYLDTDGITELNLYTDPGNEYGNVGYGLYEITVDPVIITSSIIIRRPYFLTLCEVEVYGVPYTASSVSTEEPTTPTTMSVCSDGFYGDPCTPCGQCLGDVACDKMSGYCPGGFCKPGWQGLRCDHACETNFYGPECSMSCGNCAGGEACNHIDGMCPSGCEPGWIVGLCSQACLEGFYGPACSISCGNCASGDTCNHIDGICPSGCEPGWVVGTCSEACQSGFYGQDCAFTCGNCDGGAPCNAVDGTCSSGCAPGWTGDTCNEAITVTTGGPTRTNVAYLKPATQNNDETWEGWNWTAAYAAEGCTDRDNLVGQTCCSSAIPDGQEQDTYWSVDLLGLYIIDLILIFGRSDMTSQLELFQLNYLDTDGMTELNLYTDPGNEYGNTDYGLFEIPVDPVIITSSIIIRRSGILTLCEVEVYGIPFTAISASTIEPTTPTSPTEEPTTPTTTTEEPTTPTTRPVCSDGFYGDPCTPCGQCFGDAACDKVSGDCPGGFCKPGWQGLRCDQACQSGFYGQDCAFSCGNCAGGAPCSFVDGTCSSGCAPGWTGDTCNDAITVTTRGPARTNVAFLKPATQNNDETYEGWNWTAAYAVEGCTDRDNLVGQTCCSSAVPSGQEQDTYWSVDLLGLYIIDLIIIFGRSDMTSQLELFQLNYLDTDGITELNLYTDPGIIYGNTDYGLFEIPVDPVIITSSIIIRRSGILTLCEVEVYGIPFTASSVSTIGPTTPTSPTEEPATPTTTTEEPTTPTTRPVCSDGFYGDPCTPCGQCFNDAACDKMSGACPGGFCKPGWQGLRCDQACQSGFYGQDCAFACGNCDGGAPCNAVDGTCLSGCAPGWTGDTCNEAITVTTGGPSRTNVAYLKPATQSNDETYGGFNWTAAYAVEGCTDRDSLVGQTCCSTAIPIEGQEPATYWSVDLLGLFTIDLIKIFGRSDITSQLELFQLNYLDTDGITELNLYTDPGNNYGNVDDGLFEIPVDPVIITSSIIIRRPDILTLCEVEVYGVPSTASSVSTLTPTTPTTPTEEPTTPTTTPSEEPTTPTTRPVCSDGFYGDPCTPCGQCFNDAACDKTSGACPGGFCKPGWQGLRCDQACSDGDYGQNCAISCGNCASGEACNHIDGMCPSGCEPGWEGGLCIQACANGFYGQDCLMFCGNCVGGEVCNHIDGTCPSGCEPGWIVGTCSEACVNGTYGQDCLMSCGNCAGGAACNHIDGVCPSGCEPGWVIGTCSGACANGVYGQDCAMPCGNCASGEVCNHVNGMCPSGCDPGWVGGLCSEACANGFYGQDCSMTCGYCASGEACNHIDGMCPSGCEPGWVAGFCSQECASGVYGQGCSMTCGNCFRGEACNHINGLCPSGCEPGWVVGLCSDACPSGVYGQDCSIPCGNCVTGEVCNHIDGMCPSDCEPGWVAGLCSEACANGFYGDGCSLSCGNCAGGEACNHIDGICPSGCEAGWVVGTCSETCANGVYGQDCSMSCGNCVGGETCNHIDGICPSGCESGWEIGLCSQACVPGSYGQYCLETCGNCLNAEPCHHVDGFCQNGCAPGWIGYTCTERVTETTTTTTISASTSKATVSTIESTISRTTESTLESTVSATTESTTPDGLASSSSTSPTMSDDSGMTSSTEQTSSSAPGSTGAGATDSTGTTNHSTLQTGRTMSTQSQGLYGSAVSIMPLHSLIFLSLFLILCSLWLA